MGKKDIEENIWTNKGKWTVENYLRSVNIFKHPV
jgi:hypothetical protein